MGVMIQKARKRARDWAMAEPSIASSGGVARSDWPTISLDQWAQMFSFGGNPYGFFQQALGGTLGGRSGGQEMNGDFASLAQGAYRANGVIFAISMTRMMIFAEARFQYQTMRGGRPGDLFGNASLGRLEEPWPNGTTSDLLSRMIQDVDLGGNFYGYNEGDRICRMRPDWVSIVLGTNEEGSTTPGAELDAHILGYLYWPGGKGSGRKPKALLAQDVAHWAPIPDPLARYRGMPWIAAVIREIMADTAATEHKEHFFENGATPNIVVTFSPEIEKEAFDIWRKAAQENMEGPENAYKTLYLGGGAQAAVVGKDLGQISFKEVQGAGETRMAAAAGMPPIIVGLSEGLQASTYSNYVQAKRRLADMTMRPLWRSAAGALAVLVPSLPGARLWYDDRDIAFLKEDVKDAAEVLSIQASTVKALLDAGYDPDAVVSAVLAGDLGRLSGQHSGLFSVQLQPPGTDAPPTKMTLTDGKGQPVAGGSASGELPPARAREIRALLERFAQVRQIPETIDVP